MLSIEVLLVAASVLAPPPQPAPTARPACRAEVAGTVMMTQIRFSDGYTVSAPWTIVHTESAMPAREDGVRSVAVVLDRVEETSADRAYPVITSFDRPVLAMFSGQSDEEIMYHAAQSWCSTVLQSRMAGHRSFTPAPHKRMRIAALLQAGGRTLVA